MEEHLDCGSRLMKEALLRGQLTHVGVVCDGPSTVRPHHGTFVAATFVYSPYTSNPRLVWLLRETLRRGR